MPLLEKINIPKPTNLFWALFGAAILILAIGISCSLVYRGEVFLYWRYKEKIAEANAKIEKANKIIEEKNREDLMDKHKRYIVERIFGYKLGLPSPEEVTDTEISND